MVNVAAEEKRKGVGFGKGLLLISSVIIFIILLIFVVAMDYRQSTILTDSTYQGTIYGYLYALQLKNYRQAREYISTSAVCYPDLVQLEEQAANGLYYGAIGRVDFSVQGRKSLPDGVESVSIHEYRHGVNGLLDQTESINSFNMKVRIEEDGWRILESDLYWFECAD